MNCPKCKSNTSVVEVPEVGVSVDRCNRCHGIWLDCGEVKKFHDDKIAEIIDHGASLKLGGAPGTLASGALVCPRCEVRMKPFNSTRTGLHYEGCETCYGVFLDAGELLRYAKVT